MSSSAAATQKESKGAKAQTQRTDLDRIRLIAELATDAVRDAGKLYEGDVQKSAVDLRAVLQKITLECKEGRKEATAHKSSVQEKRKKERESAPPKETKEKKGSAKASSKKEPAKADDKGSKASGASKASGKGGKGKKGKDGDTSSSAAEPPKKEDTSDD